MNIYLDIDGVLLMNENHLAPHAEEFLLTLLAKHPDATYWLTTHCWQDQNRTHEALDLFLEKKTIKLLDKVKPTSGVSGKQMRLTLINRFCGLMMIYLTKKDRC